MRFFKRDGSGERLITCPSCSQLISADSQKCEMCGADLSALPADRREGIDASTLAASSNPYAR